MPKPTPRVFPTASMTEQDMLPSMNQEVMPQLQTLGRQNNNRAAALDTLEITVGEEGSGADHITTGANDDVFVQDALNQASQEDGFKRVRLFPGNYSFGSGIEIPDGVSFQGAGRGRTRILTQADFDDDANHAVVGVRPATNANGVTAEVTEDVAKGDTWIHVSNPGLFSPAQYLLLRSAQDHNPTLSSSASRGEVVRVSALGARTRGAGGSITEYDSTTRIGTFSTTTAKFSQSMVGAAMRITGAATDDNNAIVLVRSVGSAGTTFTFFNQKALAGVDANNGALEFDGHIVAIYGHARDEYDSRQDTELLSLPLVGDIEISGIEFRQAAALGSGRNGVPCVALRYAQDCSVHDLSFYLVEAPGVLLENCIQSQAYDLRAADIQDYSVNGFGSIVIVDGASEGVSIRNIDGDRVRHGVISGSWKSGTAQDGTSVPVGGVPRAISVSDCLVVRATDVAYMTGPNSDGWVFSNCIADNCEGYGFALRGNGHSAGGCTVTNGGGGIMVGDLNTEDTAVVSAGVSVRECRVRHINPGSDTSANLGGQVLAITPGVGGNGIYLARCSHAVVTHNEVEYCYKNGVVVGELAVGCLVAHNLILEVNQSRSGNLAGIAVEPRYRNTSGDITAVSGSTATFQADLDEGHVFDESAVGQNVDLTSFTGANNGEFPITAVLSPRRVEYTNASASVEASGFLATEGPEGNWIHDNIVARRPWHKDGAAPFAAERGSDGHAEYGVVLAGGLTNLTMVTRNMCLGATEGRVSNLSATNVGDHCNQGSPEAFGIPILTGAVDIDDDDYEWSDDARAADSGDIDSIDENGVVSFSNTGANAFRRSDVGKVVTITAFGDAVNNGTFVIRSFVDSNNITYVNKLAKVDTAGDWTIHDDVGVDEGAMAWTQTLPGMFVKDDAADHTHTAVGGGGDDTHIAFNIHTDITSSSKRYMPTTSNGVDLFTPGQANQWLAPTAGQLMSVMMWPNSSPGSTIVGLHINGNTTPVATVTMTPTKDAVNEFDFSGDPLAVWAAGDYIMISSDPTNVPNETDITVYYRNTT